MGFTLAAISCRASGVRRNPRINREGRFESRQKRLRHRPDCPPRYRLRPAAFWPDLPGQQGVQFLRRMRGMTLGLLLCNSARLVAESSNPGLKSFCCHSGYCDCAQQRLPSCPGSPGSRVTAPRSPGSILPRPCCSGRGGAVRRHVL